MNNNLGVFVTFCGEVLRIDAMVFARSSPDAPLQLKRISNDA
jgi:hypothetical protein